MTTIVRFGALGADPPPAVRDVVDAIVDLQPDLGATLTPSGGITRALLDAVIHKSVRSLGFMRGSDATIAAKELDYTNPARWTAISIQAGRAMTNNGALLAVLAAASARDIDWLVLLVPDRYKGGATYAPVVRQMLELETSPGIRMELEGVVVIPY